MILSDDGTSKADIEVQKPMLGACRGSCVRLDHWRHGMRLIIAEGLETSLAIRQRVRELGWPAAVWSAVTANGMSGAELPSGATDILVAIDNDDAGVVHGNRLADRLIREGRQVRIARPSAPHNDFNDELMARAMETFT